MIGRFIKFAFAKTTFDYIEKEIPEIDMKSYRQRVRKEYRAIVERTPRHRQYERQYVCDDHVCRGFCHLPV